MTSPPWIHPDELRISTPSTRVHWRAGAGGELLVHAFHRLEAAGPGEHLAHLAGRHSAPYGALSVTLRPRPQDPVHLRDRVHHGPRRHRVPGRRSRPPAPSHCSPRERHLDHRDPLGHRASSKDPADLAQRCIGPPLERLRQSCRIPGGDGDVESPSDVAGGARLPLLELDREFMPDHPAEHRSEAAEHRNAVDHRRPSCLGIEERPRHVAKFEIPAPHAHVEHSSDALEHPPAGTRPCSSRT